MKNPNEPRRLAPAGINANRRKLQTCTGPLHGLRADNYILPGEDPAEFLSLLHDHLDRFRPVGAVEEHLVLRVAGCQWRLSRTLRMKAAHSPTPPPITGLAGYQTSIARSLTRCLRLLKIYRAARIASVRPGARKPLLQPPIIR